MRRPKILAPLGVAIATVTVTDPVSGVTRQVAAPAPPVFTVAPSISGTPEVGSTLTGTDGTVEFGTITARQWLRDGAPISGATGSTYQLVEADEGADIAFRVTATGDGGTVVATSEAVGPIAGATAPLKLAGTGLRWPGTFSTVSGNNFKAQDYAIGMPDVVVEEVWFFFPTFYMNTAEEVDTTAAYTIEGIATRASGGARTRGLVNDGTAPVVVDPANPATQYGRWVKFTPAAPIAPGVTQVFTFAFQIADGTVPQPRAVQTNTSQTNVFGEAMPVERWTGSATSLLSTLSDSTTYNNTNGPRPPVPAMMMVRGIETAYMGLGDSIQYGSAQSTATNLFTSRMAFGNLEMAMDDNLSSARIPGNNLAMPGWNMTDTATLGSQANATASARQLWAIEKALEINAGRPIADLIVCGHGQNSVNEGGTVLIRSARALASLWRDALGEPETPIWWIGMPAVAHSSDGFQTTANQAPRETSGIYPTGGRWVFNAAQEAGGELRTDGTIQAHASLWPVSSADSGDDRDILAVRPFNATLTSAYSGTGTMFLSAKPTPGAWLNFVDGTTIIQGAQVTAAAGETAPFEVTIGIPGSPAISSGAIARERWNDGSTTGTVGTFAQTGVHPSTRAHVLYSAQLIGVKVAEGFTPPLAAPVLSATSISGTPENGQTLTANFLVTGAPTPTITYQWKRNGTNISGQTSQTILLNAGTMGLVNGDTISCEITATNSQGSDTEEPTATYVAASITGFVGQATATITSGTNITCNVPAGAAAGDTLVAFGVSSTTGVHAAPSGWVQQYGVAGRNPTVLTLDNYDGTTPSFTFTSSTSGQASMSIICIRGYDVGVVGTVEPTTAVVDPTTSAITVPANDSLILAAAAAAGNVEWSMPAGWTRRSTVISNRAQTVFERDAKAASGSLSGVQFTRTVGSVTGRAVQLSLTPS